MFLYLEELILKIKHFDTKALDEIIEKMMYTVGNSKH